MKVEKSRRVNNNRSRLKVARRTSGLNFLRRITLRFLCAHYYYRCSRNVLFAPDINTISCLPLSSVSRGYLICSRSATSKLWRDRRKMPNRPGTRCFLKCPHGYQLRGEYELTCRSDGNWDGPKYGKCISEYRSRLHKEIRIVRGNFSAARAEKSPGNSASLPRS